MPTPADTDEPDFGDLLVDLSHCSARRRRQAIKSTRGKDDPLLVSAIVRIARNDSSVRARKEAARRLAECRGRSATDALLACALNDIVVVQVVALEALTVHAHELSAASIVPLLENKHSSVRMRAAELLGEVGDASSVGALIAVLHDDAWVVRVSSAEALVKIGDPQALQPLRELREHSGRFSRRGLDTMIFELESRTTKQR